MWGNRLGWMISAGVAIVTIGLYAMLIIILNAESDPTALTTKAGAMDAISLPTDPAGVFSPGNGSADEYAQAIAEFRANQRDYTKYLSSGKVDSADFKKLKAVEMLLDNPGKGAIFAGQPSEIATYDPKQGDTLSQAEDLGQVILKIGNQLAGKEKARAKKYFTGAYNFGKALVNERITFPEFMAGMSMMKSAAAGMRTVEPDNLTALKQFADQTDAFIKTMTDLRGIFNPAGEKAKRRNAGDVFNFARNSQERMWKVEAILMLGHYRYNAGTVGDQRAASKILAKLTGGDTDPIVQAAVTNARELNLGGHNRSMSPR